MHIHHEIDIDADVESVWHVVGERFADIGEWATSVPSSRGVSSAATAPPDAPVAGRTCEVTVPGMSALSETLTAYDRDRRTLTYRVDSGMPRFVRAASNTWTLADVGSARTRVRLDATFETRGVAGRLAAPFLRRTMRRALRTVGADLAHYVETGRPVEAKRRSLAKAQSA